MAVLYTNNAFTLLATGINSSVTSMSVTAGEGVRFPVISGADYFFLTITSATLTEIVKVTARSTDTMTIVRAQDGTIGQTFSTGDSVQLKINKAMLDGIKTDVITFTDSGIQTLTNKRIDPRDVSASTAATLTPDLSVGDMYAYTALAAALTINAPIGTPVNGEKMLFRFLDNGSPQALTWNATYTVIGPTLPATTVSAKTTYVGCLYNANNTRWDVIAVTTEA
jgi:hypothetical protein